MTNIDDDQTFDKLADELEKIGSDFGNFASTQKKQQKKNEKDLTSIQITIARNKINKL